MAEPLYLLADSAVVGTLGTAPLAGLGLAGTVLTTAVGLCVVLAYGTTATVSRRLGAGDLDGALRAGLDGMWLGLVAGTALAVAGVLGAPALLRAMGASADVLPHAVAYLRVSALGLPAMLLVLAATGVLRGLQDTRTPLVVAVWSAAGNAVLSAVLVLGLGLGVAGSAAATVVAQVAAAAAYLAVLGPALRRSGVPLRPRAAGLRRTASKGGLLLLRTATLRAALVGATVVATSMGDEELAAHHVVLLVWSLLALVLDAVAIAAQALTGRSLGAGDAAGTRTTTRRMVQWGAAGGVLLGLVVLASAPLLPALFSSDPDVRRLMTAALVVAGLLQPVAGVVFVLDGVLIGAGDDRYLALAGLLPLAAFAAAAGAVVLLGAGLSALW
ncbi:MAG TPA: MATE family efflux transporter, partial [Mycobacteriales bacterium]|nr:MATE family efflux transporter [Mycobacteriales bacterium]